MLLASPPPQSIPAAGTLKRRSSQWDSFTFTEVTDHVEPEISPRQQHHRPRRNSLRIKTQKESLEHRLVTKQRKLMATMLAVAAFLDLLKQVREARGHTTRDEEAKIDELAASLTHLNFEPTKVKSLRFDVIEVRQYETILEVNPGSSKGPALGIGWKYHQSDKISVDEYERTRPPRRVIGKDYRPLTTKQRTKILKQQGYSDKELKEGIKATDAARAKRKKTIEDLKRHHGVDKCSERMEMAALKLQRVTRMRRSSDAEIQQLWTDANSPKKPKRKTLSFNNRHDRKHHHKK